MNLKKSFLNGALFLAAIIIAFGTASYFLFHPNDKSHPVQIYFPKKTSVSKMGESLAFHGVVPGGLSFSIFATVLGKRTRLKWGEYIFAPHSSLYDVFQVLVSGTPVQRRITIPEGLTSAQIIGILDRAQGLQGTLQGVSIPEGSLLPETYYYHYGDTKTAILDRMANAASSGFEKAWTAKTVHTLPTLGAAVVLASIVERETAKPAERSRIARVFLNRLARGMKLQSDVTVLYGKNQGRPGADQSQDLTKDDLRASHPFNTYLNAGLPPSPICHPGMASLWAVLNPVPSNELYFVADGTGGHVFSETHDQHQKNHQIWRRIRAARQN